MEKPLEIVTQITWEDYKKFNFHILLKNRTLQIALGISIILITVTLLLIPGSLVKFGSLPFFLVLFLIFLPLFTYYGAKRAYNANSRLTETITYKFDKEWIESKGQSFETKMSWDKIYQVVEGESWFLIYQTKMLVNIIPKGQMGNEKIIEMRDLLKSIPNLKLKLMG